ncbi:MAG: hypothetical protein F6K50_16370 [Moorea sp. SIO3I7]|uniref:hypothetical protein n=1 Tax=Moorena sp. SIO3I6 TaxID=2607831 RepID=UPI0013C9594B|nr:hypothetical protein [Moorena sp. SIO3I6]NEN97050.1 hypothetical protein [Moorena sp. SIO3I7]
MLKNQESRIKNSEIPILNSQFSILNSQWGRPGIDSVVEATGFRRVSRPRGSALNP